MKHIFYEALKLSSMMTDVGITEVNEISNAKKKMIINEAVLLDIKVFSNYFLF